MKTNLEQENTVLKSNIEAIRSMLALLRSTIGPKGLDAMLVDEFGHSICSNDGIEILRNLKIQHPAARLAVEAVQSQEIQAGDGTTTCAVYIDSMLASAERQVKQGFRPIRLIKGMELACNLACNLLETNAQKKINDEELKAAILVSARQDQEISDLVFQSIKKNSSNLDLSEHIVTSLNNKSRLLDGLFIKKKSHFSYSDKFSDAPLLLIEGPLEPEPMSSEIVSTEEGVKKYENNLQSLLDTATKIIESGTKIVLTNSSIYPSIEEFLVKEGVLVLSHLSKRQISNLAKLSDASLINRAKLHSYDLNRIEKYLGLIKSAKPLDELGGFLFKGKKNLKTILISSQMQTSLDERERIVVDAIRSAQNLNLSGAVLGEGVAEMNILDSLLAERSNLAAKDLEAGSEIIEDGLKAVFWQIIDNAGLDYKKSIQAIDFNTQNKLGVDLESGSVINLQENKILDPLKVKLTALKIATELVTQVLKINAIVQAK